MSIKQKIHFNYEDEEVKLDFSFDAEDPQKCVNQMLRFKGLMEKAIPEVAAKIKEVEGNI